MLFPSTDVDREATHPGSAAGASYSAPLPSLSSAGVWPRVSSVYCFLAFPPFGGAPAPLFVCYLVRSCLFFPGSLTRALFVLSPVPPLLTWLPLFSSRVSLGADECLLSFPPEGPCLWFWTCPKGRWQFAFAHLVRSPSSSHPQGLARLLPGVP